MEATIWSNKTASKIKSAIVYGKVKLYMIHADKRCRRIILMIVKPSGVYAISTNN